MFLVALTQSSELGAGDQAGAGALGFAGVVGFLIAYVVMLVGAQLVSLFLLSGIEHLVLQLSGEKNLLGYSTTVRAHALGLAPWVFEASSH
jgi:hypothetical protein